uniref:Transposase n=1 Tax=Acrobeloides nanus TaxID=290746 RepID=A0A914DVW5_9BILA
MTSMNKMDNFCEKIIELFRTTKHPEKLVHRYQFTLWDEVLYSRSLEYLTAQSIKFRTKTKGWTTKDVYEIHRKDRWLLCVSFERKTPRCKTCSMEIYLKTAQVKN